MTMPQIEPGDFATPFTTGTRSNTQTLLDWTGNNTITANSLTYNSDGTFSFNGQPSALSVNTTMSTHVKYTRMVWLKATSITGDMKSAMLNVIGNNSDMAVGIENYRAAWHQYTNSNGSTSGDYSVIGSTLLTTNQVYCIAATVDRSTSTNNIKVYLNGNLETTASRSIGNSNSNTMIFGGPAADSYSGARMFFGDIYAAYHYDRVLSTDEIAQNFQALRGRYGI
jgi:hypothetical protein